ncbi:unnamed protein product [Dovyalis caffra]|uniref:Uncharacterized protein n=1 Tax=Dovyalis caffra TaxID=77055 RepID=A0AAV1R0Q4_9ROSI|nr:unnamed protein product [Dovyalis caffra]
MDPKSFLSNSGASVTEVTEIISGDTTNVHGNLSRNLGLEYLFLLGHGIVQFKLFVVCHFDLRLDKDDEEKLGINAIYREAEDGEKECNGNIIRTKFLGIHPQTQRLKNLARRTNT